MRFRLSFVVAVLVVGSSFASAARAACTGVYNSTSYTCDSIADSVSDAAASWISRINVSATDQALAYFLGFAHKGANIKGWTYTVAQSSPLKLTGATSNLGTVSTVYHYVVSTYSAVTRSGIINAEYDFTSAIWVGKINGRVRNRSSSDLSKNIVSVEQIAELNAGQIVFKVPIMTDPGPLKAPGPVAGTGLPLLLGAGLIVWHGRRRRNRKTA